MTEYKQDYYRVGTQDDIVVSNSSMTAINPDQGGSPKKFLQFFAENKEEEQSISLERGSLLHLWHEHEDKFIISDVEKPSKMMSDWVERVFKALFPTGLPVEAFGEDTFLNYKGNAYSNIKDPKKHLEKFKLEGLSYLEFLFKADGKYALTPATKEILVNSMASLQAHHKANDILFGTLPDGMERFKEAEIYWSMPIKDTDRVLKQKAKIDNFIVDYKNKRIFLNDLKSTSKPVSLFKNSFTYYHYYRQLAFYGIALYEWLKQRNIDPEGWSIKPRIVAVDSTPQYNTQVFLIDSSWQTIGVDEVSYLNALITFHILNNEWIYTAEEKANNGDTLLIFDKSDEVQSYSNRAINN